MFLYSLCSIHMHLVVDLNSIFEKCSMIFTFYYFLCLITRNKNMFDKFKIFTCLSLPFPFPSHFLWFGFGQKIKKKKCSNRSGTLQIWSDRVILDFCWNILDSPLKRMRERRKGKER